MKDSHGQTVQDCEYCGPVCYRGAGHNARVEDNARFEEARTLLKPKEITMENNSLLLELLERHHTVNKGSFEFRYLGTPLYVATIIAMANGIKILDQSSNFFNELRALRERDELRESLDNVCKERDRQYECNIEQIAHQAKLEKVIEEERNTFRDVLRGLKDTLRGSNAKTVASAMIIIDKYLE